MSGYFAPDSMVVRALGSRAVGLTYGQRALVIGALHPRLFVGTAQHTSHRRSPYTRLGLTARLFEAVFLGTREEADRALAYAAKRHETVRGAMSVDGGAAHRLRFKLSMINRYDWFHPNSHGQEKLAEVTFPRRFAA